MQSWWCRQDGCWHRAFCCCLWLRGFELGRQAAWRPRGNHDSVVKTLVTPCSLLISRWLACQGKESSPVCGNPQSQSLIAKFGIYFIYVLSVKKQQSRGHCRVSGFVTEFELGRQAAWRPRGNRAGVVKTLMALCILLLCCGCGSRTLYEGFELGRQAAWRPRCNRGGVDKTVVGTVQSAAVCGCVSLGLSVHIRARSSRLINGRVQS